MKTFIYRLFLFVFALHMSLKGQEFDYDAQFSKYPRPDFSKILLVINYNHPFYDSIPLLKEFYGEDFPNIVFYGEQPHPEVNKLETGYGWWAQNVIKDAMKRWPKYEGYLCIQDDCFINFWNLTRFDKSKIWFMNGLGKIPLDLENHPTWGYWNSPAGRYAVQIAYSKLPNRYYLKMVRNLGTGVVPMMWSDFVYVPGRLRNEFIGLATLFLAPPVFIELAVPSILSCLDDIKNWEIASVWNSHTNPRWAGAISEYNLTYDWVHPFKLSQPEVREFASKIISEWKSWKQRQLAVDENGQEMD